MLRLNGFMFVLVLLLQPASLWATPAHGDGLYLDGGKNKIGVILCHGRGQNGDGYVVGSLRMLIHEELGYHTLALLMPGGQKPLVELHADFATAGQCIEQAIMFLRQEKDVETIILLGHSLGSRMASAWLASSEGGQAQGFIGVSMLNNGGSIFDCSANLQGVQIPVLDILGTDNRFTDVDFGKQRRHLISPSYSQVIVEGADHAFSEHDDELFNAVDQWLKNNFSKK